jgi:hypothetical protein
MSNLDKLLIELHSKRTGSLDNVQRVKKTEDLKLKKVAFDVYKIYKDQYEGLWTLEKEADGSEFLVRASNPQYDYTKQGEWSVANDYDHSSVTVNYKGVPICSFACNDFGVDSGNIDILKKTILEKVSSDNEFVSKVLSEQNQNKVSAILTTFPEFKK